MRCSLLPFYYGPVVKKLTLTFGPKKFSWLLHMYIDFEKFWSKISMLSFSRWLRNRRWRANFQSGSRLLKKVFWTFSYLYLWYTMWFHAKKLLKTLKFWKLLNSLYVNLITGQYGGHLVRKISPWSNQVLCIALFKLNSVPSDVSISISRDEITLRIWPNPISNPLHGNPSFEIFENMQKIGKTSDIP